MAEAAVAEGGTRRISTTSTISCQKQQTTGRVRSTQRELQWQRNSRKGTNQQDGNETSSHTDGMRGKVSLTHTRATAHNAKEKERKERNLRNSEHATTLLLRLLHWLLHVGLAVPCTHAHKAPDGSNSARMRERTQQVSRTVVKTHKRVCAGSRRETSSTRTCPDIEAVRLLLLLHLQHTETSTATRHAGQTDKGRMFDD